MEEMEPIITSITELVKASQQQFNLSSINPWANDSEIKPGSGEGRNTVELVMD